MIRALTTFLLAALTIASALWTPATIQAQDSKSHIM